MGNTPLAPTVFDVSRQNWQALFQRLQQFRCGRNQIRIGLITDASSDLRSAMRYNFENGFSGAAIRGNEPIFRRVCFFHGVFFGLVSGLVSSGGGTRRG